jgi:hypothetical protein
MVLSEIIAENRAAVEDTSGDIRGYFDSNVSQNLMAYYRTVHPEVSAIEFIRSTISGGTHYGSISGEGMPDASGRIIEFVGKLFGEGHEANPTLYKFEGEPVEGKIYIALVRIDPDSGLLKRNWSYQVDEDTYATFESDYGASLDNDLVGLYQKGNGFTFLGDKEPISSASIADIDSYILIDTQE